MDRINECRSRPDGWERIKCLRDLLGVYGDDGMILLRLGEEVEAVGRLEEALEYYRRAYQCFPLERWKRVALEAVERVEEKLRSAPGNRAVDWDSVEVDENTLFVVNCTARKAWDVCKGLPERLPALLAYQGSFFHRFLTRIQALERRFGKIYWVVLSAKYGFLEPCSPIENYDVTFGDPDAISLEELRRQVHELEVHGRKLSTFTRVYVYAAGNKYYEMACNAFKDITNCTRILD